MTDGPLPYLAPGLATIRLTTDPTARALTQGGATAHGAGSARAELRSALVRVGRRLLRVKGADATVARHPIAGRLTVAGPRDTFPVPFRSADLGEDGHETVEVEAATACELLSFLGGLGWQARGGDQGFRGLYTSGGPITPRAIEDLVASEPEV